MVLWHIMAEKTAFNDTLLGFTENFLTRLKQKQLRKRVKQAKKHPIIDWIEAFLWAAMVVLLINQYALQAYVIPSGSMRTTLIEGDRVFVDKFSYGPELLPGILKLPGIVSPHRNDVMCFENPAYQSRGTLFMIAQRMLYMLTLSMVDLDLLDLAPGQELPSEKMYLLIKRVVGIAGEQWRVVNGEFEVKVPGHGWMREADFKAWSHLSYQTRRDFKVEDYQPRHEVLESLVRTRSNMGGAFMGMDDLIAYTELEQRLRPRLRQSVALSRRLNGWYIPQGYLLPLGDNRDNSNDGRYFGPVAQDKVLGRALNIYWPLDRFGVIQ
jgi:signal peptidase I